MTEETIVAIATPPGRGGIGVVRLSGDRAIKILHALIRLPNRPLKTQHATPGEFVDPDSSKVLDKVVVTCFCKPHSYTGEDVVEISCHGSPVILQYLVECCVARGARAAEPGEFTMRAFLNGRIDLAQAEAIRDLIDSRTLFQAQVAAQQMGGSVSARLKPHKEALLNFIARLEAGIDFAEDDVSVAGWEEILSGLDQIQAGLGKLVESYRFGRIVREGLSLAIVGRPNVGKSSLFNRLLNEDRAIVTEIPGTTRDLVSETANLDGIPLRLVDTAGIRDTTDPVEKLGVERSYQALVDSDLRLLVIDASQGWSEDDSNLLEKIRPLGPALIAFNKCDLLPRDDGDKTAAFGGQGGVAEEEKAWISALTGEGLPQLREKILSIAAPARNLSPEGEFITNLRHQQALKEALGSLAKAREAAINHMPHEMLLLDLYEVLHALDMITGATTTDDVLGVIFSTFCVGK
jgi:tRNA modification GTPase